MIHVVLRFLAEQLNQYVGQVKTEGDGVDQPYVILQNISRLDENELRTTNKILITLVNLAEDQTLKNFPNHILTKDDKIEYSNPPVNLNLYILVTSCMNNYENALIYLSHAIAFFQGKYIFTIKNSSTQVEGLPEEMRIILDLHTLGFEQLNYLWSTLGGKQHPFICYKIRVIKIEKESLTESRGIITEVKINGTPENS